MALAERGGDVQGGGLVTGPSPLRVCLVDGDILDEDGEPCWFIHAIEGDGSGGAWRFLHDLLREIEPAAHVWGEVSGDASKEFWRSRGGSLLTRSRAVRALPWLLLQPEPQATGIYFRIASETP